MTKFRPIVVFLMFSVMGLSKTLNFYLLQLDAGSREKRTQLANFVHFDHFIDGIAHVNANQADYEALKKAYPELILEAVHTSFDIEKKLQADFPDIDKEYHTYNEMRDLLLSFETEFKSIASVSSIGKSIEGRELYVLKISSVKKKHNDVFIPAALFVGSHHAREHLSTEVPLKLAEYLLRNYESNESIKHLIDSREIYFIPMLNPDGAMHDISTTRYLGWRKNRKDNGNGSFGVDLNRNYDWEWGNGGSSTNPRSDIYMGKNPFSEPETIALKNFIESKANIRNMISFHTYSELVLYPWGGSYDSVGGVDQQVFEATAKKMASWNGYKPQQSSDLYVATGDTCDWAYGEHQIFCYTFELTPRWGWGLSGFYPGVAAIDKTFKENIRPVLHLIETAIDPYIVLQR